MSKQAFVEKEEFADESILDKVVPESNNQFPIDQDKLNQTSEYVPARTDIDWSDYVMSQFSDDEVYIKKKDGKVVGIYPRVAGLRRVAQILVGEIVDSQTSCVSPPKIDVYNDGKTIIHPACFIYTIKFVNTNDTILTYSDAADVWYADDFNCNSDIGFARFSSSLATTRAESRVLRKALDLSVCSAEELGPDMKKKVNGSAVPVEKTVNPDDVVEKYITLAQKNFLTNNCKRLNINPWALLNSGETKYDKVNNVSFGDAVRFGRLTSEFIRLKANDKKKEPIQDYEKKNKVVLGPFNKDWETQNTSV